MADKSGMWKHTLQSNEQVTKYFNIFQNCQITNLWLAHRLKLFHSQTKNHKFFFGKKIGTERALWSKVIQMRQTIRYYS